MDLENPNSSARINPINQTNGNIASNKTGNSKKVTPETETKQPEKQRKGSKTTIFFLVQVLLLLLLAGFLAASLAVNILKARRVGGLQVWKWCMFVMSVLCGFTLVFWLYWPVMLLVEKAFALKEEVIYFVYGLRKCGAFFIWWVWVLLMWLILLEQPLHEASPRAQKALEITTRSIISLATAAFAWILVTVALRLLSVKCRFNRYIKKIRDASFNMYLLRTFSEDPDKRSSAFSCCLKIDEEMMEGREIERFYTLNSDTLGFLKGDCHFDHEGRKLEWSTLRDIPDISTDDVKAKARYIFQNVINGRSPGSMFITVEDLSRFLIKKRNVSVENAMKVEIINDVLKLFNATESHVIDRSSFVDWVVELYQERKILFQALNDNKSATKQLSTLLKVVLVIMSTIGWLIWIDILTFSLLAALITTLAGGIFIFGESMKMTFQSILFVFLVHPFDIGDKCIIEGSPFVVEQMNIMTTVFLNANNEKTYFPNYALTTQVITNSSRSSPISDSVHFTVDVKTPIETIASLKENIKRNLDTSSITMEGFDEQGSIKMTLKFNHKIVKDKEVTIDRKTEVIMLLIKSMKDLNIMYSSPSTEDLGGSTRAWEKSSYQSNHPHSS